MTQIKTIEQVFEALEKQHNFTRVEVAHRAGFETSYVGNYAAYVYWLDGVVPKTAYGEGNTVSAALGSAIVSANSKRLGIPDEIGIEMGGGA